MLKAVIKRENKEEYFHHDHTWNNNNHYWNYVPAQCLCERYERIVIGDYGAYVEISASHLSDNHFIYIDQNDPIDETISSRHSSHMTLALNDESSYTIYFQVKPVPYGNFIPGRFYIDPYDVISDIREE